MLSYLKPLSAVRFFVFFLKIKYTVTKIIDTIALFRVVPWDFAILWLNYFFHQLARFYSTPRMNKILRHHYRVILCSQDPK